MSSLINKKGFYCASDTVFFNEWTRLLILSARRHVPWAHLHVHVYDGTSMDERWCKQHGVTFSSEDTPLEYSSSLEDKRGFWVCDRFRKIPELYSNDTPVWAIDSDSLFHRPMSELEFDQHTRCSWVNLRQKPNNSQYQTIGYAVGFAAMDRARYELARRLSEQKKLAWFLDQVILDQLYVEGFFLGLERSLSDHLPNPRAYIWSAKGDRKYQSPGGLSAFPGLAAHYRKML